MAKEHEFALYSGDGYLDGGTAKELAKKYRCRPEWIRHMSTPTYRRRLARSKNPTGRAKYAIKLGEPET